MFSSGVILGGVGCFDGDVGFDFVELVMGCLIGGWCLLECLLFELLFGWLFVGLFVYALLVGDCVCLVVIRC